MSAKCTRVRNVHECEIYTSVKCTHCYTPYVGHNAFTLTKSHFSVDGVDGMGFEGMMEKGRGLHPSPLA